MNKIRILPLDFSKHWIMIAAALLYGIALGFAVSVGKTKTWTLLLVPTSVCIFLTLSDRLKFWLLALSIPLSLVQIPRLPLPYGTQVSEAILVFLALDEILFSRNENKRNVKPLKPVMLFLLGLFAFAGLIANLRGNNLYSWNVYCLSPLIIFFLISRKIHNWEDAWMLVKLSLLTIVGFIAIIEWAIVSGHYYNYDPLGTEKYASAYRMADGMVVMLGPIRLTTFATRLGAIAALGFPTCVLLWLENKGKLWLKTVLLLVIAGLGYIIILSATRGSFVAAILGSLLAILISGRFRSPLFVGATAIALVVLTRWGGTILSRLPGYNVQRLLSLSQGVGEIANFQQRMDVLALAWNLTLKNPLGVGFGYLYHTYQIDDAIIYAVVLQATGILGALAFIMMVGYLAFQFGLGALKSPVGSARDLASVGLSTLAAGLLAGISSQSILFEPVHSFVFWTLMAVCFHSIVYLSS